MIILKKDFNFLTINPLDLLSRTTLPQKRTVFVVINFSGESYRFVPRTTLPMKHQVFHQYAISWTPSGRRGYKICLPLYYTMLDPVKKPRRWTQKYKKSINCKKPKGFSQKQYCKYSRNKNKNKYK